jgi:hypothetical protein
VVHFKPLKEAGPALHLKIWKDRIWGIRRKKAVVRSVEAERNYKEKR